MPPPTGIGIEPGQAIERDRAWAAVALLSLLVATALALCVVAQAVPLVIRFRDVFPFGDMVDVIYRYFAGPSKDFWIYHDNDHLPLFVMPFYWIDMRVFRAQGTFLIACNLLLALAIALAPGPAIFRATSGHRPVAACAVAVIVAMHFWLGNYVDLVWTKQVHMYVASFAVMMAIGVTASAHPRTMRHAIAAAVWLTVATFSFGYGIIGFPVILILAALRRWDRHRLAVIGIVFVVCIVLYFATTAASLMVDTHTTDLLHGYRQEALYALTFVAAPPFHILQTLMPRAASLGIAWSLSGIGLVVLGRHVVRYRGAPQSELDTWVIGLALFTVLVAGVTAYARPAFGYFQAADDRYVIGQLPFWVGLLLLAVEHIRIAPRRIVAFGLSLALICAGLLVSQDAMLPALRLHNYGRWSSAMSAIDNVADPEVYARDNIFHTDRVAVIIEGLRMRHWAAVAWPQAAWIGRELRSFGAVQSGCVGALDTAVPVGINAGRRLAGWAADSRISDRSLWIALVDPSGIIRGLAHGGGPRPDVAGGLHSPNLLYVGWTGYVPVSADAREITAYLLMKDKHPCRLGGPPPATP